LAQSGLREVDGAEIVCLVDNVVDLLLTSTEVVQRPRGEAPPEIARLMEPGEIRMTMRAEHGFSALISSHLDGRSHSILLDAGLSVGGLVHNMDALRIDPNVIEAIVLSHGHPDHTAGLNGLAERLQGRPLPLILHPDAWLERHIAVPGQKPIELARLDKPALMEAGFQVYESRDPTYLADNTLFVTGEVERTTDFEKGFPVHRARRESDWAPDPFVLDDQAVVVNVRAKGLIVVTGCGHSGIINILRYAQKITGVKEVYAVIGGFHLNGPLFEPIIPSTVEAMREIGPQVIAPTHCTGWKAIHAFAAAMPQAFVQNSVGTRYVF
jgi:7,8-dihydropterin-6-yl-methyl-4-(beta-D-ribofuranosyl)aminobenzene 5'-phosphate synthase